MEKYITDYLDKKGIKALGAVKSDLSEEGIYHEAWAAVNKEQLVILKGIEDSGVWNEESIAVYKICEFDRYRVETFVSCGILIGQRDGREYKLITFSDTPARAFGRLANLLNKLREDKPTEERDFVFEDKEGVCPKCGRQYADKNIKFCRHCTKRGALLKRVLSYGAKYKGYTAVIFIGIMLAAGITIIRPLLNNKILFDDVLNTASPYYGRLGSLMLAVFLLELVNYGLAVLNGRLASTVAARIIYDIKTELFTSMQKLSLAFYNSKHTGNLMTRVNSDAQDVQYFLSDGMPYFFMNLINLTAILVIMLNYNPLLGALVFVPVPVIILIINKAVPKFRKFKWASWARRSALNSRINDVLTGERVVKAFGKETREKEAFAEVNGRLYTAHINEGVQSAKTFPLLSYLMTIGALFVWSIGGMAVVRGNMTFGVLTTIVSYIGMLYGPLDFMVRTFDWYTNCMNSSQRIFEIIDRKTDVPESEKPVEMPQMHGEIELCDVTFEYEPNKPVLHGVNLKIKPGEMIGLVGHSGAGKSTITNLITRLYDVTDGAIKIDGVDIRDIKTSDLRSHIGMVLQDTFLFAGTVAENIAYAKPDATRQDIIAAAKLANAHDFIMKLPDGYETMLGKRKNNLSGGEKQRLSIARAVLVNPKILILDEATASVDTETERRIQEALERLVKGRTTIAIAHRLSTLRNADRLVVVDHGRIAEVGTHEELEEKKGVYYDLLQIQKEALRVRS